RERLSHRRTRHSPDLAQEKVFDLAFDDRMDHRGAKRGGVPMATVKAIPDGLHTVTPQITIDGAAEAIEFLKDAFGAEEIVRAPDPSGQKIWHAMVRIGNSMLFLNDAFPDMGGPAHPQRLWLYSEDIDGMYKRAVGAGATSNMEPADMFW